MVKKIKTDLLKGKAKFNLLGFSEDIPNEVASFLPRIITNGITCSVEGNCQITEYEDTSFKINFKKGSVLFSGENFNLIGFNDNQIVFEGKIASIEYILR